MNEWEPPEGWGSIEENRPGIYRYADWAHTELDRLREALLKKNELVAALEAELIRLRRERVILSSGTPEAHRELIDRLSAALDERDRLREENERLRGYVTWPDVKLDREAELARLRKHLARHHPPEVNDTTREDLEDALYDQGNELARLREALEEIAVMAERSTVDEEWYAEAARKALEELRSVHEQTGTSEGARRQTTQS